MIHPYRPVRSLAPFLALVLAACSGGGESSGPPETPSTLTAGSSTVPSATVGTALTTSPTFVVRNSSGQAIAGLAVSVTVSSGGGTLTGAPTRSEAGPTSIGQWTLGTVAGTQSVTVTIAGVAPLILTATANASTPVALEAAAGNGQTGLAGVTLATPVSVKLRDQFGNGVAGANVSWTVENGGGTLSSTAPTVTGANGTANAPAWTLGRAGGPQSLIANSGTFSTRVTANIQTSYAIDLRWASTPPTGATLSAFTRSVDRIRATIIGGVSAVQFPANFNPAECGVSGQPNMSNETVQGVVIFASVQNIDGPGGVLGSAFPCIVRDAAFYGTALGVMRFDAADMPALEAAGTIESTILHEMLHVVGFGTLWRDNNLIVGLNTDNAQFLGQRAKTACINQNGGVTTCSNLVPIHSTGPQGSIYSHWRESSLTIELMTPTIQVGVAAPYSATTIESMGDIGYTVNRFAADPFQIAGGLAMLRGMGFGPEPFQLSDPLPPRFKLGNGKLTRLEEKR